ncbi:MAG: DUF3179 domain-containing (seleno)protein, partial [Candidatus Limnocylindria bacterium]
MSSSRARTITVLAVAGLVLAACSADQPDPDLESEPVPGPTASAGSPQPIGPERAAELMDILQGGDGPSRSDAFDEIAAADDQRFVAVLMELHRASEVGVVPLHNLTSYVAYLEQLTGEEFSHVWPDWVDWYGATDLEPPPGFAAWKGRLLGGIDPAIGEFLADPGDAAIRIEEIVWGGVRVEGIPPLEQPAMLAADEASYLEPDEPVFGIALDGEARAYPLRIMDWHEMANDTIAGVPFSLAYCTLCGAGIAWDNRAPDGETYDFGTSGLLYRSNKLMYDRQTRSLWNQFTGTPVVGELAGREGLELDLLPIVLTSWDSWQDQ